MGKIKKNIREKTSPQCIRKTLIQDTKNEKKKQHKFMQKAEEKYLKI